MILSELLSRIYSVSFLSSVPIWLGQKWVLLHQKCAVKFPIRLSIVSMRPNPQRAHRCRVLAKTRNLEPNRKRRKLTDASKPGRKFEFKSLSGVDPLEEVLKTALSQLDSPCVQLPPRSLLLCPGSLLLAHARTAPAPCSGSSAEPRSSSFYPLHL